MSGQPLSCDLSLPRYRIFSFCRIFDDVIIKNADISKNNDVMVKVMMKIKTSYVPL